MKIFYIHHALRATGNPPSQDDGLQELGIADAEIVAKLFQQAKTNGLTIKAIYSSNYFRCKETSKIINEYINAPIIEDARLNEYVSVRQATKYGLPENDPSIETWLDCQMRIINCIKDIVEKHEEKDVVICVTSGVNITPFISLAYQVQPSNDLPCPSVPSCSPIAFEINKSSFSFIKDN